MNKSQRLLIIILVFIFSLITYVYFLSAADDRLEKDLITDNSEKKQQDKQLNDIQITNNNNINNEKQHIIDNKKNTINQLPIFNLSIPISLYNTIENSIIKADITWY